MENQINAGDQNTHQIGQNPINQSNQFRKRPKMNYLLIGGMILVYSVLVGFGGYYFGKQSSKNTTEPKQNQTAPLQSTNEKNGAANWRTYKNFHYGLKFDYPQSYIISTNSDCSGLINNQPACLLALAINPSNSDYSPKAHFWLLRGINSVNIPGQVSSISFDSQKRAWVLNQSIPPVEVLSVWNRTKSGQEIIKSSNGGSHGSSYYYIIPKYENDEVAIFAVPQSYRLRCDNFFNDKSREADCNSFYESVIDEYNEGKTTDDTWLPENYLSSMYSEAENVIKSYEDVTE